MSKLISVVLVLTIIRPLHSFGQGWMRVGQLDQEYQNIKTLAFDPATRTLYATADSGVVRLGTDGKWSYLYKNYSHETNFDNAKVTAYYIHDKIWKHPFADSVWFLSVDDLTYESNPALFVGKRLEATLSISWEGGGFPQSIVLGFSKSSPQTIYGTLYGLRRSDTFGATWVPVSNDYSLRSVPFISVDEWNTEKLYTFVGRGLTRSSSAGQNWETIKTFPANSGAWATSCIARNDTVVVGISADSASVSGILLILFSADAGARWNQPLFNRNVYCLTRDSRYPNRMYAGGDGVMLVSLSYGFEWSVLNGELPRVRINQIVVDPDSDALYVGTQGSGVLKVFRAAASTSRSYYPLGVGNK